jgi:hypothetical protein
MKQIFLTVVFISSLLFPQGKSETFNTGDVEIDQHLQEINMYAKSDYESFKKDLSMKFGISTRDVDRYTREEKVRAGDLYCACSISSVSGRNVHDVIGIYKEKKGWGALAQEYGIKPGSKEFQKLKGKTLTGIGKVKTKHTDNSSGNQPKNKK